MSFALGLNIEAPDQNAAQWGQVTQIGCKFVRYQNPSMAIIDKADTLGIKVLPMITSLSDAGIPAYVNQLYSGSTPRPGWCGVIELGNECYGYPTYGTPRFANGTLYANAVKTGMVNTMSAHPSCKFTMEASYNTIANWNENFWAAMGSAISTLWAISPHMYTLPRGGPTAGDPISGAFSLVAQFIHWNTFLKAQHASNPNSPLNMLPSEQGWSTIGSAFNAVPSEAIQADYYSKAFQVMGNVAAYVPGWVCNLVGALFFELPDNPWQPAGDTEGGFGLTRSTKASFSQATAPTAEHKPAWAVVATAMGASGSADFTGTTGGSGGGGGGGGGTVLQPTLTLNPADHTELLIGNIDPSTLLLHEAWTQKPTYVSGDLVMYVDLAKGGGFPSAISPPDPDYPYGNVIQYDGPVSTGSPIGVWYDAANGGLRPQTFPDAVTADKPIITSATAGTITPSGATISIPYDLGNQTTGTLVIRHGTTTGYGQTTTPVSLSTATGTATVPLTGYQPGQVVHYEPDLTSAGGPADTTDHNFTTSAGTVAPTITDVGPTSLTPTSVKLNASVVIGGAGTSVQVKVGTTVAYELGALPATAIVVNVDGSVQVSVTALVPQTQYVYEWTGHNLNGDSPVVTGEFATPNDSANGAAKFGPGATVIVIGTSDPDWIGVQGVVTFASENAVQVAAVGMDTRTFAPADLQGVDGTLGGLAYGAQVKILAKTPKSLSGKTGTVTWSEGDETVVSVPGHHPYAFSATHDLRVV